jgi:hypothetical protein
MALTARLAPAESPPIAIRRPSPFHRRALSLAHRIAKIESSSAAGNGCSGGEPIVEDDRQITRFGELHPELAKRGRAAKRPATAVQVDDHGMWTGTLGHRHVGAKART